MGGDADADRVDMLCTDEEVDSLGKGLFVQEGERIVDIADLLLGDGVLSTLASLWSE